MNTDSTLAVASYDLIPSTMAAAIDFSERMANAKLLPAHLQKSPADCLRVVLQAARWQMDPFAVADKTSVISGKLMFEGQLVSAVVNARGNLKKRLSYDYKGEGSSRVLTVSGTLQGEDEPRTIELTHALATKINRNGQVAINPDQQMSYIGARIWARRHTPELMLGVYVPDEMEPEQPGAEPTNVTPAPDRPDPATLRKRGRPPSAPKDAIDIPATPAETPAATPEPPKPEKPADAPAQPATPAKGKRTSLEKGEKLTIRPAAIISAVVDDLGGPGKPGCIADIRSPQYEGKVYDMAGARMVAGPDGAKAELLPVWANGAGVALEVEGRGSKAHGVIVLVTKVTPIAPQEEKPKAEEQEQSGGLGLEA